jgi:hypothetical protein
VRRTVPGLILALAVLIAVHALARIARRGKDPLAAPGAAELTWLLVYVLAAPSITKNTPKTNATKARVDNLVSAVGATNATVTKATSQAGTGGSITFTNLQQTETGSPQAGGAVYDVSSAVEGGATIQTGNPNGATVSGSTVAAHTHGYGHIHDASHYHFNQMAGDFNGLITQLNTMKTALQNAGIL